MPLPVPENDPLFPTHTSNGERRCLPFARSLLGQLTLGYRNQINQVRGCLSRDSLRAVDCLHRRIRDLRLDELRGEPPASLLQGTPQLHRLRQRREDAAAGKPGEGLSLAAPPPLLRGWRRAELPPAGAHGHAHHLHARTQQNRHAISCPEPTLGRRDSLPGGLSCPPLSSQETRRIVVAEQQHIVFGEFLPKVIGLDLLNEQGLVPKKSGYFSGFLP